MKHEALEVVRGSGNVFRDLKHENANVAQVRAILAVETINTLDREGLSVRAAQNRPGVAAADFSRLLNADLHRFTINRLMAIINRLGSRVDVKVERTAHSARSLRGGSTSKRSAMVRQVELLPWPAGQTSRRPRRISTTREARTGASV